jgi:tRNA nucleotidyltransferase/poly(A) polymerase
MKVTLPFSVLRTIEKFNDMGAEIYVVGGAVRDILSGAEVDDWDFTTNLIPEEILKLFPENSFYDNQFGTVGIKILSNTNQYYPILANTNKKEEEQKDDGYEIYEITTFRTESNYTDRRRPGKVEWGKTLEEDLQRRDFTINSIAIKIKNIRKNPLEIRMNSSDQVEVEVELIDLYHGQQDLKDKLIRAVGTPDARFQEDALRMMRAIRISTELGFQIEQKTFDAIKNNHELLKEIAQERITEEFRKIMASAYPVEGVKFLQTTGILEMLIPELLAGYGMAQKGHHIYDVYEHALKALQFCENSSWIVRFAALIHDIGKPVVAKGEGEARTFYNHEIVGTNIAWDIAKRFKLSREETKKLTTLVRWHMFSVSEFLTDAAVRRFIRRVGQDNIADMMDVRIADRLGSGCTQKEVWRLRDFKTRVIEVQKHIPSVNDLKVNGNDVMKILGIPPGPRVGKILNELFEEIMEDPKKNEKKYLLERIAKYKK